MKNWERNIKALADKNKQLADEIKTRILQGKENSVQIQETGNGNKVLTVARDGYIWYLNSRLDPDSVSNLYADRYESKPFYRYFIFGFSDGMAVRKILQKCIATSNWWSFVFCLRMTYFIRKFVKNSQMKL